MPPVISQREPHRSDARPASGAIDDDQERHRQERRARLDGGVAEHVLHVERDEEEDAEHRERDEEHREVRADVGAVAEQRQVEHRRALAPLEEDEGGERDDGDDEGADDPQPSPSRSCSPRSGRR